MQHVLEQGSIDNPLTFDVGLIQLSFILVCSPNTCNISVNCTEGLHFSAFHLFIFLVVALNIGPAAARPAAPVPTGLCQCSCAPSDFVD